MYRYSGTTWTSSNTGLPATGIQAFATDATGAVYASTYNDTYRSTDGGLNWTLFLAGISNLVFDPTRAETAYLCRPYAGVERSVNSLGTRASFATGLPNGQFFSQLGVDRNGGTVYFGVTFRGIYRVTD